MQEFFNGIAEILEIDVALVTPALKLGDYAWDSLAIISTIAMVDEQFDKMLEGQALAKCETLADVIALIGIPA